MVVKKFYGNNTREALRQVRDALGADALILSNRQVGGGIEIMAVADTDVAVLTHGRDTPPAHPQQHRVQQAYTPWDEHNVPAPPADPPAESIPAVVRRRATRPTVEEPLLISHSARRSAGSPTPTAPHTSYVAPDLQATLQTQAAPAAPPLNTHATHSDNTDILNEVKTLRALLESQLAGFAWGEITQHNPAQLDILRQLLASGLSPRLAREIFTNLPAQLNSDMAMRWVKNALLHNLLAATADDDLVENGGVIALVGPTGVGKTTTVAKLAARYTLRHGPQRVALISTDSYRIGAHDQLRIYGKILDVPVYSVKDEDDLQLTLADLSNRHLVLIDTVGMSQRDQRLTEQIALLSGHGQRIKRLLLLAANTQGATLDDVLRRYQQADLSGCILTKIDEATNLGPALDVLLRYQLPLHFVANGQRVPEDLHLPNPSYLVDRALRLSGDDGAFKMQAHEYPLLFSSQPSAPVDAMPRPRQPNAAVLRSNRKPPRHG